MEQIDTCGRDGLEFGFFLSRFWWCLEYHLPWASLFSLLFFFLFFNCFPQLQIFCLFVVWVLLSAYGYLRLNSYFPSFSQFARLLSHARHSQSTVCSFLILSPASQFTWNRSSQRRSSPTFRSNSVNELIEPSNFPNIQNRGISKLWRSRLNVTFEKKRKPKSWYLKFL